MSTTDTEIDPVRYTIDALLREGKHDEASKLALRAAKRGATSPSSNGDATAAVRVTTDDSPLSYEELAAMRLDEITTLRNTQPAKYEASLRALREGAPRGGGYRTAVGG
jgi:hypothetical protein